MAQALRNLGPHGRAAARAGRPFELMEIGRQVHAAGVPRVRADSLSELARGLGVARHGWSTVERFNAACRVGPSTTRFWTTATPSDPAAKSMGATDRHAAFFGSRSAPV